MSEAEEKLRKQIGDLFYKRPPAVSWFEIMDKTAKILALVKEAGWKSPEEIDRMFNPDYLDFKKGVIEGRRLERESIISAIEKLQDLETWAAVEFPEMKRRVHEIREGLEKL